MYSGYLIIIVMIIIIPLYNMKYDAKCSFYQWNKVLKTWTHKIIYLPVFIMKSLFTNTSDHNVGPSTNFFSHKQKRG